MKRTMTRSVPAALLLTAAALLAAPPAPGDDDAYGRDRGEVMLQRTLEPAPGGRLSIDVPDADVEILGGESEAVEVTVFLDARNMRRARDRYEEMELRVEQRDGDVRIDTGRRGRGWHWSWNWGSDGGFQVTIEVRLPRAMNVDVSTSDGDILLTALEGEVMLETSDGDIDVRDLHGEAQLYTSDGNIEVLRQQGPLELSTSDGDIDIRAMSGAHLEAQTSDGHVLLEEVTCPEIRVRSSDGEIEARGVEADEIVVRTSDGGIDLQEISGEVIASTSDGEISAEIVRFAGASLESGGGDIWISVPEDAAAELDIEAERVRFREGARFTGRSNRDRVDGALNGGGPLLEALADDGEVVLKLRAPR
jgi:hypothetical protein